MKNRSRIIGLAVAGVVGTSGAAFAGMGVHGEPSAQPQVFAGMTEVGTRSIPADGTTTYQVGVAGTVAISRTADSLNVSSAVAGAGWSVFSISGPGGHVEVQFADAGQLVTFSADAVGDHIAVAVANVVAPGASTTTAVAAPIEVRIIGNSDDGGKESAKQTATPVMPATPASSATPTPATSAPSATPTTRSTTPDPAPGAPTPTSSPTTLPHNTTVPTTAQPSPATTASPSYGDEDDNHGDDVSDDHDESQVEVGEDD